MNQPALVSVVMCTYNGEKYLNEQIESILKQSYENLELVIVDDVSHDNTVGLIKNWMEKDQRIRFSQNETNVGYNRNFEKAIALANGDYIALSDQDDIWLNEKIEKLMRLFIDKSIVLAHGRSVELIDNKLHYPPGKLLHPFKGNDPRKLIYDNAIGGHKIMFKKELIKKIIPVPNNMFYDWWIGVVATCNGSINSTGEYLVHYRIHEANAHINVKEEIKAKHIDHITAWKYFVQIPEMQERDKAFLKEMIKKFQNHRDKKHLFDYKFFFFLLKNRYIIFANRRKLVKDFLHLKFILYYSITKF